MKKIFNFVLTGGPCGGKSTAINKIYQDLSERGYKVLIVPETATELINSGITVNFVGSVRFQEILFYKQLKKEAKDLTVQIEELNNPEYLASYARENYSYSKDGEYIIKLNNKEKEVKKVDKDIKVDYVVVGISIFVVVFFTSIILRGRKSK